MLDHGRYTDCHEKNLVEGNDVRFVSLLNNDYDNLLAMISLLLHVDGRISSHEENMTLILSMVPSVVKINKHRSPFFIRNLFRRTN